MPRGSRTPCAPSGRRRRSRLRCRGRRPTWRAVDERLHQRQRLIRIPVPSLDARSLLLVTTCVAAAAAFVRDRVEHGTVGEAFVTAGIEGMAVVACFLVLGSALGLRRR
jgi:hypothetical protein